MRAMRVRGLSADLSSLRLEEVELPPPGAGEVRVRIRACGVNFPDILMVQGKYQHKPALPFSPGMEFSGEVLAGGGGFRPGDGVIGGFTHGGFAEEVNAPAASLRPKPPGLSWEAAAAYSVAWLTAYVSLVRRGALQKGETLLVHGSAGGVGLAAVELGKILGARVIATASSDEKLRIVKQRGADHVLNVRGGFREQVKALTGGRGADVIYDPVGGDVFDESVRCIGWNGRLLVVGFAGGRIPEIAVNLPLIKGFSVVGVRAGEYGRRDPERGAEDRALIDRWAAQGLIRPYICRRFRLEEAGAALALLAERQVVGKAVIVMEGAGSAGGA